MIFVGMSSGDDISRGARISLLALALLKLIGRSPAYAWDASSRAYHFAINCSSKSAALALDTAIQLLLSVRADHHHGKLIS